MVKEIQLRVNLIEERKENTLLYKASKLLKVDKNEISAIKILRKSIDARKKDIIFNYKVAVYIDEQVPEKSDYIFDYKDVSNAKEVHIIGFGPAGMYAALRCIELGYKPVVLERGKNVQDRRRDLKAINQDHFVNEDSNYCFGEGGAGTYSDGKLYTRSLKRGDVRRIFENLVFHGATEQILVDAHPHIGTNKLPKIIKNIRENILKFGGEIYFNTKVIDFVVKHNKLQAIQLQNGKEMTVNSVILATGHSARDIYELLHKKEIALKAKSFAMGVRVEHPQEIIDQIQYHCSGKRDELLPAAAYSLVHQVNNRGVYSFCMCPGGFIVPAATATDELVVNGMSPSKRDNQFANSGIVVAVELKDLRNYEQHGALAGLAYQREVEQKIWKAGGSDQTAPAQRLTDFVKGKSSSSLNDTSYMPGLNSVRMDEVLPPALGDRLRQAFPKFGQKMRGYMTEEANVIGIESRTSSPVRIPRKKETLQHPQIDNLFPCGEGAGYAGGIVSAGIDGENCADAAFSFLKL